MKFIADDPINRSIWNESIALQRKIAEHQTSAMQAGAQQSMPKDRDTGLFSASNPLPWVPDLCGCQFGQGEQSVLVVGSSYNGFIKDYSPRTAVMPLRNYLDAKNDANHGVECFCQSFVDYVVRPDEDYYMPILRDLLQSAGCPVENCCLTDLCKASFVERGSNLDNFNRGDKGSDPIIKTNWMGWIPYVVCGVNEGSADPLPYQWIWQRMRQARLIIALGTIAEYGILKMFLRMAVNPEVCSWKDRCVIPDDPTMSAQLSDWKYCYATSRRYLRDWLSVEDWWILRSSCQQQGWFLMPVYHPAYAIGRCKDIQYRATAPRVHRMMEEAAKRL